MKPQTIHFKIFVVAFFMSLSGQLFAQDINLTQYRSSPLIINPANTGLIKGDWRAAINYRNDWNSISVPFITNSFSYDMSLFKGKLKRSSIGIGVLGTYSQSGDGDTEYLSTGLSLAYHQRFGNNPERPSTISLGFQPMYVDKKTSVTYLTYGPVNVYEVIDVDIDPYLDYNAGLMYSGYINARSTIYAGIAAYHFTRPIETILGDEYKVHNRISTTAGGSYKINKKYNLFYSGVYHQQGKFYDVILGGVGGMVLNSKQKVAAKKTIIYLGAWYRYNDALAPYFGLEWRKFQLGFSYDVNTSGLTAATRGRGAFEVSLIYNGAFSKNSGMISRYAVPRF